MKLFKLDPQQIDDGVIKLVVGFGEPATNAEIVSEVDSEAPSLNGQLLLINGPASLPVAFVIAHKYVHTFAAVACFDPKLGAYVVSVSHDPNYRVGQLVKEEELVG